MREAHFVERERLEPLHLRQCGERRVINAQRVRLAVVLAQPLTDAVIGQGKMSIGGGGYGGGGLPYPSDVLQLWGGELSSTKIPTPAAPMILSDDNSGVHHYSIVAIGVQGIRTAASRPTKSNGLAKLRWDSVPGGDAYVVLRDGKEIAGPLRIEGSQKIWTDKTAH